MGHQQPSGSQRPGQAVPELHTIKVCAINTGKCMEEPVKYGEECLHLGSGKRHWAGWTNIDQDPRADVQADIRTLPYADGVIDRIAAIHVLEHFYAWDVEGVLAEWFRVLKPGGRLTLELPCMDLVVRHMVESYQHGIPMSPIFSCFPLWGDPKYKDPAMTHKWGYFRANVEQLLLDAGFESVQHEDVRYHFPQRDMRLTATKGVQ